MIYRALFWIVTALLCWSVLPLWIFGLISTELAQWLFPVGCTVGILSCVVLMVGVDEVQRDLSTRDLDEEIGKCS